MTDFHAIDLRKIARQAMASYGFNVSFPEKVIEQVKAATTPSFPMKDDPAIKDLRSFLWSSIDNHDSLDLDQVEFCQKRDNGEIHVRVAIADVDYFVPKDSLTDKHVSNNATSVYMGIETFHMLPTPLSHDLSSLKEGEDRLAIVIEYLVSVDGTIHGGDVYRAIIHNYAKLVYEEVGDWLEGRGPMPAKIASLSGLKEQIQLQDEAASRLLELRRKNGAIELAMIEAKAVIENDTVIDLKIRHLTRANLIIENFMVAANQTMVGFLMSKNTPMIQRIVRTPERWMRIVDLAKSLGGSLPIEPDSGALADFLMHQKAIDPNHFPDLSLTVVKLLGRGEYTIVYPGVASHGHFGLAVLDYTHSTAPNRRYVDLVIQRLIKSVLAQAATPYTKNELRDIAGWCSDRDQASKKVERFMRKVEAAVLLSERVGETFEGIITGASIKGTYVRLIHPPAEGRIIHGEEGLDVGQKVRVRLTSLDPAQGFIDFVRVNKSAK